MIDRLPRAPSYRRPRPAQQHRDVSNILDEIILEILILSKFPEERLDPR